VKHWIIFNEPHNSAIDGYDLGIQAPGRCSILSHIFCREGKSLTEPYVVAHNILLAHVGAFHTYKQHFKVIYYKRIHVMYKKVKKNINGFMYSSQKNKEVSLALHLIQSGMNHCQMLMRTRRQQHEQWTLSFDGDTSTTILI
jgi:hypothetical protein